MKAVISDFGGVLTTPLGNSFAAWTKESGIPLEDLGIAMAAATERHGEHPLFVLEKGLITQAEFIGRIEAELGQGRDLDGMLDVYFDHLERNPGMIDLMRDLRGRGLRMALLTNNVREWEPRWRSLLPEIDEVFDVVVDSAFVGMRKPEPEIYTLTVERLGEDLAPSDCVFVDDIDLNCGLQASWEWQPCCSWILSRRARRSSALWPKPMRPRHLSRSHHRLGAVPGTCRPGRRCAQDHHLPLRPRHRRALRGEAVRPGLRHSEARRGRLRDRHGGGHRGRRRQQGADQPSHAPPHGLLQPGNGVRPEARRHVQQLHAAGLEVGGSRDRGALLRRRRGARQAAPARRLRIPGEGGRPLGHDLDADEPPQAGRPRVHPVQGDHGHRTANGGEALLARCAQLPGGPGLRHPRRAQARLDHHESATWNVPETGRIVAAAGHVHGGAKHLSLNRGACELYRSRPTWGLPEPSLLQRQARAARAGPDQHERFTSTSGFAVRRGDRLRLDAAYDGELLHTRVMGIMVAYLAPDAGGASPPPAAAARRPARLRRGPARAAAGRRASRYR